MQEKINEGDNVRVCLMCALQAERDALKAELACLDKDRARLLEDLDFHRKWLAGLLKKAKP